MGRNAGPSGSRQRVGRQSLGAHHSGRLRRVDPSRGVHRQRIGQPPGAVEHDGDRLGGGQRLLGEPLGSLSLDQQALRVPEGLVEGRGDRGGDRRDAHERGSRGLRGRPVPAGGLPQRAADGLHPGPPGRQPTGDRVEGPDRPAQQRDVPPGDLAEGGGAHRAAGVWRRASTRSASAASAAR